MDAAVQTSSSLMPQKKNPDILELVRSSCGRIFGHVVNLFIVLKGLPFSYNKDMQADKMPLKQGIEETKRVLEVFDILIKKIKPSDNKIKNRINYFLMATDLVDYLVNKGIPFREAHGIIGQIVSYAEIKGIQLNSIPLNELQGFCPRFTSDVYELFTPWVSIKNKKTSGSTHPEQVKRQIQLAKSLLDPK